MYGRYCHTRWEFELLSTVEALVLVGDRWRFTRLLMLAGMLRLPYRLLRPVYPPERPNPVQAHAASVRRRVTFVSLPD